MNPRMPECEHRVPFDSECRECSKRSLRNKLDDNRRLVTLLRKQLDTSIDKQLLLLNQVIDLKAENERLRRDLSDQHRDLSNEYAQRTQHLERQLRETLKHTANLLMTGMNPPAIVVSSDVADQWRNEGFDKWREVRHARIGD